MKKTIEVLERIKEEGKLWERSNVKALTHAIAVLKRCENVKELEEIIGGHAYLDNPNPELAEPIVDWYQFGKVAQAISKYLKEVSP